MPAQADIHGVGGIVKQEREAVRLGRLRRGRLARGARFALALVAAPIAMAVAGSAVAVAASGTVADVSLSVSSAAGGAAGVTWNLRFVTPQALSSGSSVTVSAPAGTAFPSGGASVYDLSQSSSVPVASQVVSGGGGTLTLTLGSSVGARDLLDVTIDDVQNPASGQSFSGVTVATSVDARPVAAGGGSFGAPGSVSGLAFDPSSAAGGASGVTWSLRFATGTLGGLAASGDGRITVAGPSGTVFSGAPPQLYDLTSGTDLSTDGWSVSNSGGTETVPLGGRVPAGDVLELILPGVTNPAAGAPYSGLTVTTSSDSAAASPAAGSFVSAGALSDVMFGASDATGGASGSTWSVHFKLSSTGTLTAGGEGKITLTGPAGTTFTGTGATLYDLTTGYQFPLSSPSVSGSGNSETVAITGGASAPGGDVLELIQPAVTNPSGGISASQVSISTSSDPSPVSASALPSASSGISDVAVSESTLASGAGAVTWTYSFVTGTSGSLSGASGGTITVSAPSGTTLPTGCGTLVIDESTGAQDNLCGGTVVQSNNGATDTIELDGDFAVAAGDTVAVVLAGVSNPAAGSDPAVDFSVSTSADATAADASSGETFTTAAAPSSVSLTQSTVAGGATGAAWSYSFVASRSGMLGSARSIATITVRAPSGTTLPTGCGTLVIDESTGAQDNLCGGSVVQSDNGATDTIHLDGGFAVAAGDTVAVVFSGVSNPPAGSDSASSFSLQTSSDTAPASPSQGAAFTAAGAPIGAALTLGNDWTLRFSPSQQGMLAGQSHATITVAAPSGTELPGACGVTVVDETAGWTDGLCGGTVVQSNNGATDTIHLDDGFVAAPGDQLRVQLSGVGVTASENPLQTTVATSSDPSPATVSPGDPPVTTITGGVTGTTTDTSPTFTFTSNEANSSFSCELDGPGSVTGTPQACDSGSQSYRNLVSGSYTFTVTATGPQGLTDPLPPSAAFTVQASSGGGHGAAVLQLEPAALDFGTVNAGTISSPLTVTVTNTGEAAGIPQASLTGPDASSFALARDGCSGKSLAVSASCQVQVTFSPQGAGLRTGTLQVADTSTGLLAAVSLSGTAADSGALIGSVTDGSGNGASAVGGASVSVCTFYTHALCRFTTTDPMGRYSVTGLPAGDYQVEVFPSSGGLYPGSAVVAVDVGAPTEVDFPLGSPIPLSGGLSYDGQTRGTPVSSWTAPQTLGTALYVPRSEPPGTLAATVMGFVAAPYGVDSTDALDGSAGGLLTVIYFYDKQGVPRFLEALPLALPSTATSVGTWSTGLGTTPAIGLTNARTLSGQGVLTPHQLAFHGAEEEAVFQTAYILATTPRAASSVRLAERASTARTRKPLDGPGAGGVQSQGSGPVGDGPPGGLIGQYFDQGVKAVREIESGHLLDDLGQLLQADWKSLSGAARRALQDLRNKLKQLKLVPDEPEPAACFRPTMSHRPRATDRHGSSSCSIHPDQTQKTTGYLDPSGTVTTRAGVPVASAIVTLLAQSGTHLVPVPNGSSVMSPSNRRNPDRTTAVGAFGWDVLQGIYQITARRSGCVGTARTRRLPVPPPVVGLHLVLRCPRLRRAASHIRLTATRTGTNEILLAARVTPASARLAGLVTFTRGRRRLGVVSVDERTGRAFLTVAGTSTRGFRARYEGDGYLRASVAGTSANTRRSCVVPRVVGKTLAAAERALRASGCTVGKITRVRARPRRRGSVLSQSPPAGRRLRAGSTVRLVVER